MHNYCQKTQLPKKISQEISLNFTPSISDIIYSASIWSSSRLIYNPSCYICQKDCKDYKHQEKNINIQKILHEKYMKYPSKWYIHLTNLFTKNMIAIGKTLLTKRLDDNNLYSLFDILLKGSSYCKYIYPNLNNWLYHSIDTILSQYDDKFIYYEFITPTKYILTNIHNIIRKHIYKKYFTILVQNIYYKS